ncbi:MAG TPA: hypothetical protein VF041_09610 [Gemmatimonadaceae bacterium]
MLRVDRIDGAVIRLRRFAALLLSVLLLQVTLAGGWLTCVVPGGGAMARAHDAQRHDAHPAMTMAAVGPSSEAAAATLSTPGSGHCDRSGIMGGCTSLAPCVSVALNTTPTHRGRVAMGATQRPAAPALVPPQRTRAPELPPPRA